MMRYHLCICCMRQIIPMVDNYTTPKFGIGVCYIHTDILPNILIAAGDMKGSNFLDYVIVIYS